MLPEEDRIRECAHRIWEDQGRPDGLAETHWRMAQEELALEGSQIRPAALPAQVTKTRTKATRSEANQGVAGGKAPSNKNAGVADASQRAPTRRKQGAVS